MGRHRLPEEKKKITLHLSIRKELVDQVKDKEDFNISKFVEEKLEEYLKSTVKS
jgi:hypothetical protein